jgi:P27 family predicted phage terminase small subunit
MPAPRKTAGRRQDNRPQRGGPLVIVPIDGAVQVPEPPAVHGGLLKASLETWERFWRSLPAQAAEDVDVTVAERWIVAHDEWKRAINAVRRQRLVDGSTGQPVLNPLAAWATSREGEMQRCEVQLGVGTKNRLTLGITAGQARLTAAQLNRMAEEGDGDEDEVLDAEDAQLLEGFDKA